MPEEYDHEPILIDKVRGDEYFEEKNNQEEYLHDLLRHISTDGETFEPQELLSPLVEGDEIHVGSTFETPELTGDVTTRDEPITQLSGNIIISSEMPETGDLEDGDVVIVV